jgi:methyltransferase
MSKTLFVTFLALLAGQRLWEVRLSQRHEALIRARGGREHAAGQFRVMQALHTGWFVAMLAEVLGRNRPFRPWLAAVAAPIFLLGQALRYAAIRTLGERWTVRVVTLPGEPPITHGIYRHLRHPNYLGVVLEIAAVPLLHTAYLTSFIFSLANALLLAARIRAEEQALAEDNEYGHRFARLPRFIPLPVENSGQ